MIPSPQSHPSSSFLRSKSKLKLKPKPSADLELDPIPALTSSILHRASRSSPPPAGLNSYPYISPHPPDYDSIEMSSDYPVYHQDQARLSISGSSTGSDSSAASPHSREVSPGLTLSRLLTSQARFSSPSSPYHSPSDAYSQPISSNPNSWFAHGDVFQGSSFPGENSVNNSHFQGGPSPSGGTDLGGFHHGRANDRAGMDTGFEMNARHVVGISRSTDQAFDFREPLLNEFTLQVPIVHSTASSPTQVNHHGILNQNIQSDPIHPSYPSSSHNIPDPLDFLSRERSDTIRARSNSVLAKSLAQNSSAISVPDQLLERDPVSFGNRNEDDLFDFDLNTLASSGGNDGAQPYPTSWSSSAPLPRSRSSRAEPGIAYDMPPNFAEPQLPSGNGGGGAQEDEETSPMEVENDSVSESASDGDMSNLDDNEDENGNEDLFREDGTFNRLGGKKTKSSSSKMASSASLGLPTSDSKKLRYKFNQAQRAALEKFFADKRNPTGPVREGLAKHLGVPERSVQVWFQNRRAKLKQDSEEDLANAPASSSNRGRGRGRGGASPRPSVKRKNKNEPTFEGRSVMALPSHSLHIGRWRRVAPLVCYHSRKANALIWYISSDSVGFKLEVPLPSVSKITFSGPTQPSAAEQAEGAEGPIGYMGVTLERPPTFFMEVFRSSGPQENKNGQKAPPAWRQCADFTEARQATTILYHVISGPFYELKEAVEKLADLQKSSPNSPVFVFEMDRNAASRPQPALQHQPYFPPPQPQFTPIPQPVFGTSESSKSQEFYPGGEGKAERRPQASTSSSSRSNQVIDGLPPSSNPMRSYSAPSSQNIHSRGFSVLDYQSSEGNVNSYHSSPGQTFSASRWSSTAAAGTYTNPFYPNPAGDQRSHQFSRPHGQSGSSSLASASPGSTTSSLPATSSNQPSPYSETFSPSSGYVAAGHGGVNYSQSSQHQPAYDMSRLRMESHGNRSQSSLQGQPTSYQQLNSPGGNGSGSGPSSQFDRHQPQGLRIGSHSSPLPWNQNPGQSGASNLQSSQSAWNYGNSSSSSSQGHPFSPSRLYSNVDHPNRSPTGEVQLRPTSASNLRHSYSSSPSVENVPASSSPTTGSNFVSQGENLPDARAPIPPQSTQSDNAGLSLSSRPIDNQSQAPFRQRVTDLSSLDANNWRRESQANLSTTTSSGLELAFGSSSDDRGTNTGSQGASSSPRNQSENQTSPTSRDEGSSKGQEIQAGLQEAVDSAAERNEEAQHQLQVQQNVDAINSNEELETSVKSETSQELQTQPQPSEAQIATSTTQPSPSVEASATDDSQPDSSAQV